MTEQQLLSRSHIPIPPIMPPVKVYQTPEAPVNTRDIKRKWENLLFKAAKKIARFGHICLRSKKDSRGTVALEYDDFFLVAKKYLWRGYMVSIHETILMRAAEKQKKVVIYIEEKDWFFALDPKRILEDDETKPNIRGRDYSQKMMNFNIRLGERVFKPQTNLGGFGY